MGQSMPDAAQQAGLHRGHTAPQGARMRGPYYLLAFFSGGLLSFMLLANGTLSEATNPGFASWVAHATGTAAALLIVMALRMRQQHNWVTGAPLWAFTGGFFGALIVIVTAIAVNSEISLAGTLALGLAGQAAFGLIADRLGLFGLPRRDVGMRDIASLVFVCVGSIAIIASVSTPP